MLAAAGFAVVIVTGLIHAQAPSPLLLQIEEAFAGTASVLIVSVQAQRVSALSVLWLVSLAAGVVARGGRLHWMGRTVVIAALVAPIAFEQRLTDNYLGLLLAAIGMMYVSGKLTRELNYLLARARYDADHDDLTGLLSRAAFRRRLEELARAATAQRPLALLLFDIDDFEVVNKTAGHAAGDALLVSVGELLRREGAGSGLGGEVAGRLGGDEFALVVGDHAEETARRVLAGLPKGSEGGRGISGSVGIAFAPRDGGDAESLLRAADIALRVSKRSGGQNRLTVYAGSSLSGQGMSNARAELARIVGGEGLAMAVQPIVDMRTGEIHAYEALARFGAGGQGSPLHWFSLADELGEREALERACVREALRLLELRPQKVARLSVNVSAPVLLDRRTLQMLSALDDLSGLIIEVTEEALVHSDAALSAAVKPLRERGARLAVDDMGAGYSGLRQVTVVHPSYLKLDRALVTGIDRDPERAALVEALVTYADRVDCLLVAEGVETVEELERLLELGVPLGQGYFFSKPGTPWPQLAEEALAVLGAANARKGADGRGAAVRPSRLRAA
jgi:diguanylate cyclase (GGDEF)-like protein